MKRQSMCFVAALIGLWLSGNAPACAQFGARGSSSGTGGTSNSQALGVVSNILSAQGFGSTSRNTRSGVNPFSAGSSATGSTTTGTGGATAGAFGQTSQGNVGAGGSSGSGGTGGTSGFGSMGGTSSAQGYGLDRRFTGSGFSRFTTGSTAMGTTTAGAGAATSGASGGTSQGMMGGVGGVGGMGTYGGLGGMNVMNAMGGYGRGMFGGMNSQQTQQGNKRLRTHQRLGFAQPLASAAAINASYSTVIKRVLERGDYGKGEVTLSMEGRTAVLTGIVESSHARDVAERLALLEPGISEVRNELILRPVEPTPETLPASNAGDQPR